MAAPADGHGPRVLIVEDNEDSRALMAMILESHGFRTFTARSAVEGLSCLRAGRYDAVLTDYHMPDRSGVWMLEQAHARGLLNGTPTIIVTADPAAPGIGAQPVVGKPVDFAALVPQLRRLIAGGASDAGDDKVGVTGEQWPGASRPHASARIELVLYVTEDSLPCHRAQAVMQQLLSDYEPGQVAFAVRNVGEHLDAAERDHILFTPTLVKRLPAPRVWVLGDLSKRRVVTDLLAMAGVAPKTSL